MHLIHVWVFPWIYNHAVLPATQLELYSPHGGGGPSPHEFHLQQGLSIEPGMAQYLG